MRDDDIRLECVRIASMMTIDPDHLLDLADDIFRFVIDGKVPEAVIPCGTDDGDTFTVKCEAE